MQYDPKKHTLGEVLSISLWCLAFATFVSTASAAPLGTTFTYQGFLEENDTPAHGTFDFEINLFDSEDPFSGTLLGSNSRANVEVNAGRFVLDLDFGADFTDQAAWLEIRVRASSGGPLTSLFPLQRIAPTPGAIHATRATLASNADFLDGLDSSQLITTESDPTVAAEIKDGVDWQELSGIPSDFADGVDDVGSSGLPVGTIVAFAGVDLPSGWLLCDGAAVSRAQYADLFAVLGGSWGIGDGLTTFDLPDLRGRVPIGSGTGNGLTERLLGAFGGTETHTLTVAEMPSHSHTIGFTQGDQNGGIGVRFLGGGGGPSTSSAGGDQPHENMQPFATVHYMIKYGQ